MNLSTDGVTLNAAFINDILGYYAKDEYKELHSIANGYDLSSSDNHIPMKVYNDLCDWIEKSLGKFNLILVGRKIGETVYQIFLQFNMISENATPSDIMKALKIAASTMIQDPEGRGWEIIFDEPKRIVMRRTQTFNNQLQLGLLDGLARKSKVSGIKVDFCKEIELGDEHDEYEITWL
jgi:hypothetical protein